MTGDVMSIALFVLFFAGAAAILMTAKDAVKCERFATPAMWYLPVEATVDPALAALVVSKLRERAG